MINGQLISLAYNLWIGKSTFCIYGSHTHLIYQHTHTHTHTHNPSKKKCTHPLQTKKNGDFFFVQSNTKQQNTTQHNTTQHTQTHTYANIICNIFKREGFKRQRSVGQLLFESIPQVVIQSMIAFYICDTDDITENEVCLTDDIDIRAIYISIAFAVWKFFICYFFFFVTFFIFFIFTHTPKIKINKKKAKKQNKKKKQRVPILYFKVCVYTLNLSSSMNLSCHMY